METGSIINTIYSKNKGEIVPEVGMPATLVCWSDRKAGEILEVSDNKMTLKWRPFDAKALHKGMTDSGQEWDLTSNPNNPVLTFSYRKNGQWIEKGEKRGNILVLNLKNHFYDYSF